MKRRRPATIREQPNARLATHADPMGVQNSLVLRTDLSNVDHLAIDGHDVRLSVMALVLAVEGGVRVATQAGSFAGHFWLFNGWLYCWQSADDDRLVGRERECRGRNVEVCCTRSCLLYKTRPRDSKFPSDVTRCVFFQRCIIFGIVVA